LDEITPTLRGHPAVLEVRYHIYAAAKKWDYAAEIARAITELNPDSSFGWVQQAYALHELKKTQEAWNLLLPVVDKFPGEYIVCYNLACYAAQLGNLKAARSWLQKAIKLAGNNQIKLMALDDPDLEPLWKEIGEL
jgi:predicted Zn-dependent protease